jgi:methylated-DNA-[protein]-cysteine S-methyltransferase
MNFNQQVWNICKKVPYDKVITYKQIALQLNSKAYRAIGNALNKNRDVTVPCHRIINSDSRIDGFAFRIKNKIKLLESGRIKIKNNRVINFESKWLDFNGKV